MSISIQLTLATILLGLMVAMSILFGAWSHMHPGRHALLGWGVATCLALAPGAVLLDRLARRRWRALAAPRFPAL